MSIEVVRHSFLTREGQVLLQRTGATRQACMMRRHGCTTQQKRGSYGSTCVLGRMAKAEDDTASYGARQQVNVVRDDGG